MLQTKVLHPLETGHSKILKHELKLLNKGQEPN